MCIYFLLSNLIDARVTTIDVATTTSATTTTTTTTTITTTSPMVADQLAVNQSMGLGLGAWMGIGLVGGTVALAIIYGFLWLLFLRGKYITV